MRHEGFRSGGLQPDVDRCSHGSCDEISKSATDKAAALERITSIEIATSKRGLTQTGTH
jgi:hypothetical protein